MKKSLGVLVVLGIVCLTAVNAYSEEWILYGGRALGMGGAGVAVGDTTTSFYWNPANAARNKDISLKIAGGLSLSAEGNVLQEADAIADTIDSLGNTWVSLQNKMDTGMALASDTEIQQLLDLFGTKIIGLDKSGQGIVGNLSGGLSIAYNHFGISGAQYAYFGGDPNVDYSNLNLSFGTGNINNILPTVGDGSTPATQSGIDLAAALAPIIGATQANELAYQAEQAGVPLSDPKAQQVITGIAEATSGNSLSATQNNSGLYLSGISILEGGITYGMPLVEEKLYLGITIKGMQGQTYYNFIKYDDIQSGTDITKDLQDEKNSKTTTAFGADLGVLFMPLDNDSLRLGLTARNINKPKFDFAGPGDYEVDMQIRAGAAYNVFDSLCVAADYDITENETMNLGGFSSQMFNAGLEYTFLGFLSARVGGFKNMADAESGPAYTGGLGVHLIWLDIDLAGAVSSDEVEIETATTGTSGGTETIREKYAFFFNVGLAF
ncbi:MAG: conjugal transfer protein TraF [Planctomycetes bacterium]|nr:conjugal transfer protein TraF [Planctomycetota bacterium]